MPDDLSACIRNWLGKPETGALLDSAAKSVLKNVRERKLSPLFLNQEVRPDAQTDELLEDIRSELVVFILENRRGIQERLILARERAGLELKNAFVLYWLDKTRNPKSDPRRYLYKRVLDAVRRSEGFSVRSIRGKASGYSLAQRSIDVPALSEEDLASVPFSVDMVGKAGLEALKHESTLLELARYFWERVSVMWGGKPIWVSVADVTRWIGRAIPVDLPTATDGGVDLAASPDHPLGPGGRYFDPEKVKAWAGQFACRLREREKVAFYLYQGAGLKLEGIAERIGYGGPSGVHYQLDQVHAKLRFFLRDLPWLSPEDLNEEAFSLFLETLLSILKESAGEP
jgi:hypothetical protein